MTPPRRSIALSLLVLTCSCAPTPDPEPETAQPPTVSSTLEESSEKVLTALRNQEIDALVAVTHSSEGILLAKYYPSSSVELSKPEFERSLASGDAITWIPEQEGDGGMQPAVKSTLREHFKSLSERDWANAPIVQKSASVRPGAYRSLFIEDLQQRRSGSEFVEYYVGNPADGKRDLELFDEVLMLGFSREGEEWKLVPIGYDSWKD